MPPLFEDVIFEGDFKYYIFPTQKAHAGNKTMRIHA